MAPWPGEGHKERGTLRASALRDLQCNQNPQTHEQGKSGLAIPEIGHVTKAGDSLRMLSHPSLPFLLKSVLV